MEGNHGMALVQLSMNLHGAVDHKVVAVLEHAGLAIADEASEVPHCTAQTGADLFHKQAGCRKLL